MGRKKQEGSEPAAFVSVKLGRAEHAKLRIVAADQDRDLSHVLTEIVRAPLDKLYRAAVAKMNKSIEGE